MQHHDTIPPGLCQCGCGQEIRLGKRFVQGHNSWRVQRKGPRYQSTCAHCGQAFEVLPSTIKKGGGKFCSRECHFAFVSHAKSLRLPQRFWAKVQKTDTCWLWRGARTRNGYGMLSVNQRATYAHRISYELHKDAIPVGMELDHLCRVRHCVNPDHLEPVTHRENGLRGESPSARAATATHCPSGHPYNDFNTLWTREGSRRCRECHRQREQDRWHSKRRKGTEIEDI